MPLLNDGYFRKICGHCGKMKVFEVNSNPKSHPKFKFVNERSLPWWNGTRCPDCVRAYKRDWMKANYDKEKLRNETQNNSSNDS